MGTDVDKNKAVELAIAQIERQFGKGAIMRLGSAEKIDVPVIPTGALSLDIALGVGGVPRGRVVEIFGPESGGKTTLALHIVAEAQKMGGQAAFIDAEHALDVTYARNIGVNTDDLLVSQPDTGEQALEIAETLVRSGAFDVIVVDSVAALVPRAELEGEMGDAQMGLQARLMSQALRKLTGTISKSKTTLLFINQLRMKIGVFFGNPETTTGGNALKFYATMRLDIRKSTSIKQGQDVVGLRSRVKVVKNKVAPPFRETEFDIIFGEGEVARISTTMIEVVSRRTPLDLTIESIGVFPHLRRPRVLWLGTGGDVLPLDKLVEKTEYALAERGFAREARPFTPHWTLARINETGEVPGLARVIEEHRGTVWARFVTDNIVLFRSELTPQGAVYTPLAEYRLGESGYGAA